MNVKTIEKIFFNKGYVKFKIHKKEIFLIKKTLETHIKILTKIEKIDLDYFHKIYSTEALNNLRLNLYKHINNKKLYRENFFKIGRHLLEEFVGSEIVASNINLSIQYPGDQNSILDMHTDFFSGESLFQVNLWVPLVNVFKTKSMFIINPKNSLKILKDIQSKKNITFQEIMKKNKKLMKWINIKYGEAIIFSPNCLHGNTINSEETTRWSFNIRYKNLFSPYASNFNNEKKIGTFYNFLKPKIITKFNLNYSFDDFKF